MWTYKQSTGQLIAPEGDVVGVGYSGRNQGLNNPEMQDREHLGPIPQGDWYIGHFYNSQNEKGPIVANLTPSYGTNTFGRGGFMIHGDNEAMNHTASDGCIVLAHSLRDAICKSGVHQLRVVA